MKYIFKFLLLCFLFTIVTSCLAKETIVNEEQQTNTSPSVSIPFSDNRWYKGEWADDNEQYFQLRLKIDKLVANDLFKFIEEQKLVMEKTSDSLVIFGWVYAIYKAKNLNWKDEQSWMARAYYQMTMRADEISINYEWARLQFLFRVTHKASFEYRQLALRLLQKSPEDNEVKFFFLRVVDLRNSQDKDMALRYLNDLMTSEPERHTIYAAAGSLYFRLWGAEDNIQHARQSLKYYQDYLERAPADHNFRPRAESLVKLIQEYCE